MFATSYSVIYCTYIPWKPGVCFHYIAQFMMSANSRIRFGLQIVFVCMYITPSHYHHCGDLSEDMELIKCPSDIFRRVCKIKHILSVTLSYYHHQIGSMSYHPLFRVRSWNNYMRYMSRYIVIDISSIACCGISFSNLISCFIRVPFLSSYIHFKSVYQECSSNNWQNLNNLHWRWLMLSLVASRSCASDTKVVG